MIKDSWKGSKKWAQEKTKEIGKLRKQLPISRDAVGLIKDGEKAADTMADIGLFWAEVKGKLESAQEEFKIWMARRRRAIRVQIYEQRKHQLSVYYGTATRLRGPRPGEVKEREVDDEIMVTKGYRLRREAILRFQYVFDSAVKALVEPFATKSMMIMSMKKTINRGSPD